jgi:alkanesulfonate monooxygenase SsuD/methylene tetrahydromethanopterin reductase-like flavin-dependent oxidoreductase (luciferase family)
VRDRRLRFFKRQSIEIARACLGPVHVAGIAQPLILLERGKFDALFVADILGVDASYKESWDTYLKEAVQVPINDSGVLAATLVAATEHLGLTFTSSILQEHPSTSPERCRRSTI